MQDSFRVAVALRIDLPYPQNQGVFAGVHAFSREHPRWKCIIDERPDKSFVNPVGSYGRYDGVIGRGNLERVRQYEELGLPFVNTMGGMVDDPDVFGAYIDTRRTGEMAAEHLMERGFQRLAFLGMDDLPHYRAMGESFSQTVQEWGRVCDKQHVDSGTHNIPDYWLLAREQFEPFLDRLTPPVAILTILPWAARMLITLCENRDWRVPQQVAVMCIDDTRTVLEFPPQITCVDCNYERVGYEAASLLDRIMTGRQLGDRRVIVPPKGIITRESTDFFAVEDDVVAEALKYISSHPAEHLVVEQIAYALAVSPRTLQRRFKQALGRPVGDEVRRLRIELAKRMLSDEQFLVRQVAQATGFNTSANLAQVFQRELGMSPNQYRKKILGK
ncbi:MAG: helix-turn-helix domain-containing protein [Phycisphaera sp.]|nr:helix-turn-helix domain-containing protein [Phycisphaera sp.]